jgi:L-alanine-DL-glutamate epimerase-like enolase superfamily enzyme
VTAAIREVSAEAFRVPLARPVRFATRLVEAREYVVAWVETADGAVGGGHTNPGSHGGAGVL